jgi:Ca2+-binding RTX toxin-like protein
VKHLLLLAVLTASTLAVPGAVSASTGSCDGSGNLTVTAEPGEVNRLRLLKPGGWEITDYPLSQLTGDSSCAGGVSATINAGDLDDFVYVAPLGGLVTADGGPGRDQLTTNSGSVVQAPVPGDYHLLGGTGDDLILGAGTGVEDLYGTAVGVDETLDGGPGNDSIEGGAGNDLVLGGDGTENPGIGGGGGDDVVDLGEGGEDPLIELAWGGLGDDRVFGGPGDDDVIGSPGKDMLFGGPGTDYLMAKDREWPGVPPAEVDELDCGPGDDHTWADPIDVIDVSCEHFGVLNDFACDGEQCDGIVTLQSPGGSAAAAARGHSSGKSRRLLGVGHFKLRKHGSARPESRTNKLGRKLVRKRGRMRVSVTMLVRVKLRGGRTKTVRKRSVTIMSSE